MMRKEVQSVPTATYCGLTDSIAFILLWYGSYFFFLWKNLRNDTILRDPFFLFLYVRFLTYSYTNNYVLGYYLHYEIMTSLSTMN